LEGTSSVVPIWIDPPGGDVRVFQGDRRVASVGLRPVASVEADRVMGGLVAFGRF